MASSNRHWPSMFKSKPCNQWPHDINPNLISSSSCHKPPYNSSVQGCEERSPEPKPRWNPKPEQIRILEAIFNSGMVNPPREEIRKIRAQLQEFGQVGDANVFYWFQNRKSRSKHKLRHLQNSKNQALKDQTSPPPNIPQLSTTNATMFSSSTTTAVPCSSSSSSDKSSSSTVRPKNSFSLGFSNVTDVSNSPTSPSVNQTAYFQANNEFPSEPFFFPVQSQSSTQGFCFSEIPNHHHQVVHEQAVNGPNCTSLLLREMIRQGNAKQDHSDEKDQMMKFIQPQLNTNYPSLTSSSIHTVSTPNNPSSITSPVPSLVNQVQGVGEASSVGHGGGGKSTVFINDVAFEVAAGRFNVREAFGDEAVLIHSFGQPVLTDQWGVTLQPLQHGASYYLI